MKWPPPWKLVKELERKLEENQELAKRLARCRLANCRAAQCRLAKCRAAEKEMKPEQQPETREPARQFKTI